MTRIRIPALTPVLLALSLCALAASSASAQTTLRYKFKEGETLNYVMDQKMKITMNVMGKNIDSNMTQGADMAWKIESVDKDGNATINISFGRMKMSMEMPMGKVEVDSDDANPPDEGLGKTFHDIVKAMSGMTITGKMSPRGEISDVQVPEKVAKKFQNLPGGGLGDMFSPDGLKRMMGQSGLVLPKQAVAKDDKWDHKTDMKLPFGTITATFNYVYKGPSDKDGRGVEKIAFTPKMAVEPDPDAMFVMKLKGQEGSGHALFDNQNGKLKEVTVNQTMEMEIDAMGQTLTQRIVQNVTTRLVDKK
jgi:hypothetical protein